jgi:hypothetical protein
MIGQTIAHYRITAKLGEGGMGAVYRATDTKLGRDVAVKVLPDSFAQDPDRMARFQREAQVLASLNHPNIAAIYGVEDRALIMELVEGEDLAGPVPVNKAIGYAHQLTDALSAAHDKGIIHRDLKPANIKITPDGVIKVLDFGLAKATDLTKFDTASDPVNSPTIVAGTMAGVIMGTAAYMAPEQARGQAVDKRADIWAFGVVLFEMLTGKPLFGGETVSDTLASVMKDGIDFSTLPKETPSNVRLLLEHCLQRDRKNRLRDLGDAWLDTPSAPPSHHKRATMAWAAAAVSLLVAIVASWIAWRATRPVERPLLRLKADVAGETELARAQGGTLLALSPDGRRLAVTVRAADGPIRLASRLLDHGVLTVLPGTDDAYGPFFSPDSQWIGFFASSKLKKISVNGGAAVTLCDAQLGRGASWGDDGNIYAALNITGPLFRIPASGGNPIPVTSLNQGERTHRHPFVLPGSKAVLFTAHTGANIYDDANIDAVSLNGGQRKTVYRGGYSPLVLSSGQLVYTHQSSMFAAPFDSARLALSGDPIPVLEDLGGLGVAGGEYSASTTGTFIYLTGRVGISERSLTWLTTSGETTPLHPAPGLYSHPRFSPDGKYLLLNLASGPNEDLWIKDLERGTFSRLTFLPGNNRGHVWTPDSKYIFFGAGSQAESRGIYVVRSDGSSEAKPVTTDRGVGTPQSLAPDGKRMIVMKGSSAYDQSIYSVAVEWNGDHPTLGKSGLSLPGTTGSSHPRLSPDGRWIAYMSSESGKSEVYVRAFPGPGGKWQVSTNGGVQPEWSPVGNQLFFVDLQGRMRIAGYTVSAGAFQPSEPQVWSEKRLEVFNLPYYAVAPDGKRIAALLIPETQRNEKLTHLVFLVNFFDEVRRRIRTGGAE